MLEASNSQETDDLALTDFSQQIKELMDNIEAVTLLKMHNDEVSSNEKLTEGFVKSILISAKPGLKTEA